MPEQGLLLIFQPISFGLIISFAVMLVLLIFSALISGSEVAFFSLSPSETEKLTKSKSKSSKRVLHQIQKPKDLLATILIVNNFINVAIVIISTYILEKLIDFGDTTVILRGIVEIGIVTFIILLIGEVIPKVYATNNAIKLARLMSFPLVLLRKAFYPIAILLVNGTSFIDKRIKKKGGDVSVDDLENALELTDKNERTDDEQKILEGIVKFGNTDAKQIMKPRMDVTAIEEGTLFEEIVTIIVESGYSRIPVYKESLDKITGILYAKDLIPHLQTEGFRWEEITRSPVYVPENKKIDDLLREFQESKVHIAIVVDEYGGSSGIVTLEDILEEIIGDISDEFDDDDVIYSKVNETTYIFEGKTPLNDLYRVLEIEGEAFEENKGESDTIAGFLIERAGKILMKNEKVHFDNFTFTIEASDPRRIKQVKVEIDKIEKENED
ncbi:MAG: putative hemolysin [Parvicellaceae bacterium]|jgi:putative hemolysin